MNHDHIIAGLETESTGRCLKLISRAAYSTNTMLHEMAAEGAPSGALIVADVQEGGRGRSGREWKTPEPGTHIAMSLLLRPELEPMEAPGLTLVAAMAVREAILEACGLDVSIKWPNDLIHDGRKLCGIMTEMFLDGAAIDHVIIGIGINCKESSFEGELEGRAASIMMETGRPVDRDRIVSSFCNHFEKRLALYVQDRNLAGQRADYEAVCFNVGREVSGTEGELQFTGTCKGITDRGELRVSTGDEELIISGGEVHLSRW